MVQTKCEVKDFKVNKVVISGFIAFLFAMNVNAAELSGVAFNDKYEDDGATMSLQGLGQKKIVFVKAFVAAFYRADSIYDDVLGKFSKRIEVEYFVNIPGIKLNNFTIEFMKKNINEDEFGNIQNGIKLMKNYFVDLKPGDRFSLTYIPGVGTKFALNGRLMGIVEGHDFARALFSVWIGEKPFDSTLKRQILGLEKEKSNELNDVAMLLER